MSKERRALLVTFFTSSRTAMLVSPRSASYHHPMDATDPMETATIVRHPALSVITDESTLAVLEDRRCTAKSKQSGERCKRYAIPGGNVCVMHGGASPQAQAAALERLRSARNIALERLIGLLDDDESPVDHRTLLDVVTKLTDKVELLEGRATARTESRSEVDIRAVKAEFRAKLDAMAERADRIEGML